MRRFVWAGIFCATFLLCFVPSVYARAILPTPEEASAQAILNQSSTQHFTTHLLLENPGIIVLDIPNLAEQGAMFNRIVALIERAGASREEVLSDERLAEYIAATGRTASTFTFGNDLRSSEFVRFYNLAERDRVSLNAEELALRQFLLDAHWLRQKYGFLQVNDPDRVVLSIPAEHTQSLGGGHRITINRHAREAILKHELGHGEYYTNPHYADYCRQFWSGTLTERERQIFRNFLGKRSYDTNNEELMINEMQAYLMHTPIGAAISPEALGMDMRHFRRLKDSFIRGNPPTSLQFVQ